MMKIIDPHLHFFDLNKGDYHWLKKANAPFWPDKKCIAKNFSEDDLIVNKDTLLAGFIHIEAGFDNTQPWREIAWLESSCKMPFKTVAEIDVTLPTKEFIDRITQLKQYPSVVGCRHLLDENAEILLSNAVVQQNFTLLAEHNLSFDLQMPLTNTTAVSALSEILTNNPQLTVIINHAGWPQLPQQDNATKQLWLEGVKKLSQFPHCAIKCSGWEMTDRHYTIQWLKQTVETCLQYFGEHRVMLASNFPLTLFTQRYQQLWQCYTQELGLTDMQLSALCYDNAKKWYRLDI